MRTDAWVFRKTAMLLTRRRQRRSEVSLHTADSYLVDPASSHMLVSKIKPCMSKYKPQ